MKWFSPKPGERRFVEKFLWWPLSFGGETRWLEYAELEEEYAEHLGYWRVIGWSDREKKR